MRSTNRTFNRTILVSYAEIWRCQSLILAQYVSQAELNQANPTKHLLSQTPHLLWLSLGSTWLA